MSIIRDTDANIFITGDAGTGKTFAIDVAKQHFQEAGVRFATVAFTGSAAFNARGVTIHSALYPLPFIPAMEQNGVGSRLAVTLRGLVYQLLSDECGGQPRRSAHDGGSDDDLDDDSEGDGNTPLVGTAKINWKAAEVLFIDEISLIDAALFALIDRRMQLVRGNSAPFGGLRVIVAGDFGQIPPLTPDSGPNGRGVASSGLFCFQTFILSLSNLPSGKETLAGKRYTTWRDAAFQYVRLKENVRSAGDDNLRRIAEHARVEPPGAWPGEGSAPYENPPFQALTRPWACLPTHQPPCSKRCFRARTTLKKSRSLQTRVTRIHCTCTTATRRCARATPK